MFVSTSRYMELKAAHTLLKVALDHVTKERDEAIRNWNELVARINAKGGENFLQNGALSTVAQFSKEDIDALIRLCHPDKHNNSETANRLTQKLLTMRTK